MTRPKTIDYINKRYVSGYITVAVSPAALVVSSLVTQEKADCASETVALPSRSSDCAERYRQCIITLATILGELAVAERDPVPEHLFGCAGASLSQGTIRLARHTYV